MPKREYKGIVFDSEEEVEFYMWTEEAMKHGIIQSSIYHPLEFVLSGPIKYQKDIGKKKPVKRELMKGHKYTADFLVWTEHGLPFSKLHQNIGKVYVDVKGSYQQHRGAQEFGINQKWVYHQYSIFVHKVVPDEFFKATWVPEGCLYTPIKGDVKKKYEGFRSVHDYLKIMGE